MKLGEAEHNMDVDTPEVAKEKLVTGQESARKALLAVIEVCQKELEKLPDIRFDTSLADVRSALNFTMNQLRHHLPDIERP